MTVQVFVTVGTSAITNNPDICKHLDIKKISDYLKKTENYNKLKTDLITKIKANLARYTGPDDPKDFKDYTAELGSLLAMKRQDLLDSKISNNYIYLLHTDTRDGELCAEVLEAVIKEASRAAAMASNVQRKKIENFSTKNPDEFNSSLKNLKELIEVSCDPEATKRFNITGGYKGLIPYATVLAWDKKMTICYLYEDSNGLIKIDPPENWQPVFDQIEEKSKVIPKPKKILSLF